MNYTYLFFGASLGGIGYYTYRNPSLLIVGVIKIVNYYHIISDGLGFCKIEGRKEPIKRKHSSINLICYDTDTREERITEDIKEATEEKITNEKKFDLKIIEKTIDGNKYYKRLYETDLNNLIKDNHFFFGFLDKPFLQVSYKDGKKKMDIHLNLKPFYINRSRILDRKFMIWFMDKYYNYDVRDEEYTLSIMDNMVVMFELKDNEYIILRDDNNNNYEISHDEII
jgi:hypothetical protein